VIRRFEIGRSWPLARLDKTQRHLKNRQKNLHLKVV